MTANKMEKYANKLCDALWSDDTAIDTFKEAIAAVDKVLDGSPLTRDTVKTQPFTDAVKTAIGVSSPAAASAAGSLSSSGAAAAGPPATADGTS